jgi:hypothetical protein
MFYTGFVDVKSLPEDNIDRSKSGSDGLCLKDIILT